MESDDEHDGHDQHDDHDQHNDHNQHNNDNKDREPSHNEEPISLTGFLFGNIDESGKLETDILDEVS